MKSWLRKLFYLDDPAQGAFFALTLWGVGYYWWFTLTAIFGDWGAIWWINLFQQSLPVVILLGGLAFFSLFYMVMVLACFDRRAGAFHEVWIGFTGWIALLVILNLLILKLGIAGNIAGVAAFMLLLQLVFSGRQWIWMLGASAALALGGMMVVIPFWYSNFLISDSGFRSPPTPEFPAAIRQFFNISGHGWTLWVGIGLGVVLISYLLQAKFFAGLGNKSFRSMFTRPVVVLLASVAVIYLAFLLLVLGARREYAGEQSALERHFGRPLSTEAFRQFYYDKKVSDQAYWDKLKDIWDQIEDFRAEAKLYPDDPLVALSPEDFMRWRKAWAPADRLIREFEVHCSGYIPLPTLDFRERPLMGMSFPTYRLYSFLPLEIWRIRFLLADGDIGAALEAYERMNRINLFLLDDSTFDNGSTWQKATAIQLGALQLLLESGRLSVGELQTLADELRRIEAGVNGLQFRSLYASAVGLSQAFDMIGEEGRSGLFECGTNPPFPLQTIRFLAPQFWWSALRSKAEIARHFRVVDFKQLPTRESRKNLSLLGQIILPCPEFGDGFDQTTARLRAMRGLIAAEEYKRKHGDYPDAMPDLPLDPFSGKPLLYRKGLCPYRLTRINWEADPDSASGGRWETETSDTEIPAIQVWSVGPDRVNNGGVSDREIKADDIRVMLRLKP